MQEYLTTKEAALFLRVSVKTLERYRANGTSPPFVKMSRKVIYELQDLKEWADRRRRT